MASDRNQYESFQAQAETRIAQATAWLDEHEHSQYAGQIVSLLESQDPEFKQVLAKLLGLANDTMLVRRCQRGLTKD